MKRTSSNLHVAFCYRVSLKGNKHASDYNWIICLIVHPRELYFQIEQKLNVAILERVTHKK